ncbi:MAG: hypothetical protein GF349_01595 [Candidatus Magasanikbacteria bacterium]|nr:hypothetical protein [Candidatus Magasanikbacteria bacterium]
MLWIELIKYYMMKDAILDFPKQFNYQPKLENIEREIQAKSYLVCGMGGSHLSADLLKRIKPDLKLSIHSNYGLPKNLNYDDTLVIFSSYSGNTEEVLDGFNLARKHNYQTAVISVGGKLLELARENNIPYIQLPDTGIQPRSALGFSLLALMKIMNLDEFISKLSALSQKLDPKSLANEAVGFVEKLKNKVPVIYSSELNKAIAYNWKIKMNETGKIPAFYNIFPELNHNEMTGFDVVKASEKLSEIFTFIFLNDSGDHPKVNKRIKITKELYEDRGLKTEMVDLKGDNVFEKIFNSLILADWIAVKLAESYNLESEQVPMVEEFKNKIK